jgi:formyltetrahydrofolate-dependent phosphoribosylglycinamide formyltransferase
VTRDPRRDTIGFPAVALARITVLVSGRGSNLGALLAAERAGAFRGSVTHVVSNRPGAGALDIARAFGVSTEVVDHRSYPTREAFDAAIVDAIDRSEPDLVVLAGFMRVLGRDAVEHYAGRLVNIHPSLLPAFPGLHTHRRAIADGAAMQLHCTSSRPRSTSGRSSRSRRCPCAATTTRRRRGARAGARAQLLPAASAGSAPAGSSSTGRACAFSTISRTRPLRRAR